MRRDEPSFDAIEATLKRSVAALREAGVPHLLGGSLASWARGGPETRHDLDLMVKPEHAEAALEALAGAGMRTERPPEPWLFKARDGDILVDVIFEPQGLPMTEEVLDRGEQLRVLGMNVEVMAIEDVLVTKLLALDEHSLDYTGLLRMARALREQVDWRTVRARSGNSPYAAAFFTLLERLSVLPREGARAAAGDTHIRVVPAGEG